MQETFKYATSIEACLPNLEALKLIDLKTEKIELDSPGALQKDELIISKKVEIYHSSYKYPTSTKMILQDISLSIQLGVVLPL